MSRGEWRGGDGLRRGVYVLPNLITSGSLFAGFYSIASTYNGNFEKAAIGSSWARSSTASTAASPG